MNAIPFRWTGQAMVPVHPEDAEHYRVNSLYWLAPESVSRPHRRRGSVVIRIRQAVHKVQDCFCAPAHDQERYGLGDVK
jgi:hypothetical protein